tara:strand:- start:29048 stop:29332 length:285 start_codon:yes stop_codon:yes gene_type:complete
MSQFQPIPSDPRYSISSSGKVLGIYGKELKPTVHGAGYLYFNIGGKNRPLGQLLCETFHGKMPRGRGVCVIYKNGPGSCTAKSVRWGTRSESRQ